jgi:hypothetical protein
VQKELQPRTRSTHRGRATGKCSTAARTKSRSSSVTFPPAMSVANAFARSMPFRMRTAVRHKRAVRHDVCKRAEAVVLEARIASLDGRTDRGEMRAASGELPQLLRPV